MEENNFQSRTDRLINWSKWVITLSFTSGLGCIIAMKTGADAALQKTGILFFYAILFFCASMVCAVLFVFVQSNEHSPLQPPYRFYGWESYNWLCL